MKYKHDFTSAILDRFLLIHQIGLENTEKYYSYPKIIILLSGLTFNKLFKTIIAVY